jgi:site-specific DNA recombinase
MTIQARTGTDNITFTVQDRAVLYARVSKDDRDNDARNLDGQVAMCREYATKKGYAIVDEIAEDERGASGASFDLAGINQFLDMAENGRFDVLIVREVDRLARNRTKQAALKEQLKQYNIRVEYVLQQFSDDPFGRFSENMMADFAELERELITLRMVRGRRNKVKAGYVLTSRAPYGYKLIKTEKGNLLEVKESEARYVRMMYDWYVKEGIALNEIAKRLNEIGAPLPPASVSKNTLGWGSSAVGKMMEKELYIGVWYYGKNNYRKKKMNPKEHWIAVPVPAIVDRAIWKQAQERKSQNIAFHRSPNKRQYLISGMVKCGNCGMGCSGSSTKNRRYYCCNGKTSREMKNRNCGLPFFRAEKMEAEIWEWIKSLIMDEEQLKKGLNDHLEQSKNEHAPLYARLEAIDRLITERQSQMERLLDLYLDGEYPKDMLNERKARLEREINDFNREKADLLAAIEQKALTAEQIQDLLTYAAAIREELQDVDKEADFVTKQRIMKALNVQVILEEKDGLKLYHTRCHIKDSSMTGATTSAHLLQ